MVTFGILFLISALIFWLLFMYGVWRRTIPHESMEHGFLKALSPFYQKSARFFRKSFFFLSRVIEKVLYKGLQVLAKGFFTLFPKAKKAFEKKDELIGLEHGPSSYFLMSVSEYKNEEKEASKPSSSGHRRNKKNV